MPIQVVVGSPFAGSGRWAEDEVETREARGERGLVRIAYSEFYTALVPGAESAYRDAAVSDSGAAAAGRMAICRGRSGSVRA